MNFKRMIPMMMIASAPLAGMAQGKAGIIESNLDRSANPAEDFYQFATGGWQKANPLPAAYSRFGSFDQLQENNNKRINGILSELLKKNYSKGTVEQKLSDFYKLAMDSVRRNREGVAPVKPILDQMEAARTVADLQKVQGKYGVFGYGVPMGMGFGADEKNSKMNIFNIYQGGLTLGQREYYLDNDQTTADIRNAYKQFVVDMFKLFGFTEQQAQQKRDLIMRFETALALISKSQTELRDVEANYNKFTLKQFEADYPNIHLQQLCAAQGIQPQYIQEMIVGQPAFLAGLDKLLATQTADELRAYMEWDVINQAANYLSDDVRAVSFGFYSQTMRGAKEDQPRWKRATSQVEGMMGEALGRIYCEKYFPASSKKRMEELIGNLQVALTERIKAQTWMSEPTKKNALDKLAAFYVKVGYPNTWKDLSALSIDPQKSYYENMLSCVTFWSNEAIEKKAGKPVDRDEWHMTPQTATPTTTRRPTRSASPPASSSIRSSTRRPTTPSTMAPSAWSLATRCSTASTTRDATTTRTATCTTGGRSLTRRASTSAPSSMPTSSATSRCCPTSTPTVTSRWARTSPTTVASRCRSTRSSTPPRARSRRSSSASLPSSASSSPTLASGLPTSLRRRFAAARRAIPMPSESGASTVRSPTSTCGTTPLA